MKVFLKIFLVTIFISTHVWAELHIDQAFDGTKCIKGHASRWTNACVCDIPNEFSGKYCSEKALKSCTSNNDCPQNSYCLLYQKKGGCFSNQVRNVLETEKAIYALSNSLLAYDNASAFCNSLDSNFRPITRQDFDCQSEGAGCLNKEICLNLQSIFGTRGFFWLDKKADTDKAYYADLNDGTVYNISKDNIKSCQVLCVKEKK